MIQWDGRDRRKTLSIHEEDLDEFLDRAITRASDRFFAEVGRSVLKKLAWAIGVMLVGTFALGKTKGWF